MITAGPLRIQGQFPTRKAKRVAGSAEGSTRPPPSTARGEFTRFDSVIVRGDFDPTWKAHLNVEESSTAFA